MPYDPRASETDQRNSLTVDEQVSRLKLPDLEDGGCDLFGSSRVGIDAPQRTGRSDEDLCPVRVRSNSVKTAEPGTKVSNPRGAICFREFNDETLPSKARPLGWKADCHGTVGWQPL